MPSDQQFSSPVLDTATDVGDLLPLQARIPVGGRFAQQLPARRSIDLALEQIDRQWRDTPRRRTLISELTALDWRARTFEDGYPVDQDLIRRIGALRSQIWLSPE